MADIFAVVADATRRDVLRILHRRATAHGNSSADMSVSELVAELGLSQPTVSKHLRVLRDADLVSVREQGQHRYYRLEARPLDAVRDWVTPFVDHAPAEQSTVRDAHTGTAPISPAMAAEASALTGSLGRLATSFGRLAADIRHGVDAVRRLPGARR